MAEDPPDTEALSATIDWRLRQLGANPDDSTAEQAVRELEALLVDLRAHDYAEAWAALGALLNWLGESDAVSDYADLATDYRQRIGVSAHPADGAAYIAALQDLARSLI